MFLGCKVELVHTEFGIHLQGRKFEKRWLFIGVSAIPYNIMQILDYGK
jgi:hypothetical protein